MSEDKNEAKSHVTEETPLHVESKETDEDLRYGWGRFKPRALQIFNNIKFFSVALALFAFIQGNAMNIILVPLNL